MSEQAIFKMLVVSTAHITEQTNELLLHHEQTPALERLPVVSYQKAGYGFLIVVPEDRADAEAFWMEGLPDDLREVLEYARSCGCSWVMLDRDADIIEELPSHFW